MKIDEKFAKMIKHVLLSSVESSRRTRGGIPSNLILVLHKVVKTQFFEFLKEKNLPSAPTIVALH